MAADARLNSWFSTASGQRFYPWQPDPSRIFLADIAHALSQLNRWGGHTRVPYSVAQHSYHVSRMLPPEKRLWGLLHDATEAYMGGDIVSPIKRHVPDLMALERGIASAICVRFGLPEGALEDPEVKDADLNMLAWEYRDLMPQDKAGVPPPMAGRWTPNGTLEAWTPVEAKAVFLDRAHELGLARTGALR